ncbi:hypothetical protein F5B20DRAFT_244141 [Whalleya microplaca]|nr:hypothetical protein F5B20DRAFT_244141 [Whalleya microplaca]
MPVRKRAQEKSVSESSSRRRSGRISSSGRKSNYFEDDDDDIDDDGPPRKAVKSQAKAKVPSRKTKDDSDDELLYESVSEDEDEADEYGDESPDEPAPPPKRGRGRPQAKTPIKSKKKPDPKVQSKMRAKSEEFEAQDDDNDDEDEDEDDDENRITFIPHPKLRDTNGVDYEDTRLHENTLLFLKDLKANNKRDWLKRHDKEYRRSLKDWESFVETLTQNIVEADETIPELPIKDVIFRIYRDIRFSKDPTPYKPHYSAAWSRTGRKGPYACYYVHAEPGNCLVGGGLWHPDADALAKLRASIDERPHRIRRVLMNPAFCRTFLPHAKKNNEKSVLAAFAAANQENALKTKPKGFHPDHRHIELLKLRNYTIGTKIDDTVLTADDAQDQIMAVIRPMVEFVTFLNNVVMPDPSFDSDSDDGEEAEQPDENDDDE